MSKIDYTNMSPVKRVGMVCLECFCAGAFLMQCLHCIVRASAAMVGGTIDVTTKSKEENK